MLGNEAMRFQILFALEFIGFGRGKNGDDPKLFVGFDFAILSVWNGFPNAFARVSAIRIPSHTLRMAKSNPAKKFGSSPLFPRRKSIHSKAKRI